MKGFLTFLLVFELLLALFVTSSTIESKSSELREASKRILISEAVLFRREDVFLSFKEMLKEALEESRNLPVEQAREYVVSKVGYWFLEWQRIPEVRIEQVKPPVVWEKCYGDFCVRTATCVGTCVRARVKIGPAETEGEITAPFSESVIT